MITYNLYNTQIRIIYYIVYYPNLQTVIECSLSAILFSLFRLSHSLLVRGWFATVAGNSGGMRHTRSGEIVAAEACSLCCGRLIILPVSHFYTDYQPIANLSKLLTYFVLHHKPPFHIPSACPTQ